MDDLYAAFHAVADSLLEHVRGNDQSKYGPIARREREFLELVEGQDYEDYLISRLPANRYGLVKEINGVRTLIVDLENIPEEVLIENSDLFEKAFEANGGAAVGDRGGIASSMRDDESDVNEVYDMNEIRLPPQLLPVFEEALVLREVERKRDLSRGTVYDWRGEIASSYSAGNDPNVAQHLISLCSTGYFDKDDVFDKMYSELVLNGSESLQKFRQIIAEYVRDNPFAVFVRAVGMTGDEVFHMTTGKISDIHNYPASPEFVDICGKGTDAHAIIDDARDRLSAETDHILSTKRNRAIKQKILRVKPVGD